MSLVRIATWSEVPDRVPTGAMTEGVELVIVRRDEPYVMRIHDLAAHGLEKVGHRGFVAAMVVPRQRLPTWDHLQFVTAQLARLPLLDDVAVGTEV